MSTARYRISILAFAAYPGEAEICCGGFLAKAARNGHQAGVVDLSLAELCAKGSVEERSKESGEASHFLNLTYRGNLGFPHGAINLDEIKSDQIKRVVDVIRKMKPEIVVIPHASAGDVEQEAASSLLDRAVSLAGVSKFSTGSEDPAHSVRQVLYYGMHTQFTPSFVCDISDVADLKLNAVRCYQGNLLPDETLEWGETATLSTSPMTLRSIEARDAYYGAMIGANYAEPFLSRQVLNLGDPVAHFRENPSTDGLFYLR